MHKKPAILFAVVAACAACQVAGRARGRTSDPAGEGSPDAAPEPGSEVKSRAQPDPEKDGAVINAPQVLLPAAENQYGGIQVAAGEAARICAVKAGEKHDCDELKRCAPVAAGTARIDYLETGVTFEVFACDADNKASGAREVVIKGGARVDVEAP